MNINRLYNKKLLYTIGILLIIGIVGYLVIESLQNRDKTAALDIQSAVPNDINVTVDDSKVVSNGIVHVKPGPHTIIAQRNGFAGKKQTVSVKTGETKTVRLLLTPNGPAGHDWAASHPDQFLEYEAQAGKQFDQNSKNLTQRYPLISHLPEIHPTWRIDYGESPEHPNNPNYVAITILYSGNDIDKQNALDWIRTQGFNPDDYQIIYQTPALPGDY
jgi:hypothetical protein